MGTGAEGEVRPCAWKWEWKLKSRIKNEEGGPSNTPQAKCDVHRIDVNAINNEKVTFAVYRIFVMCDVHRI